RCTSIDRWQAIDSHPTGFASVISKKRGERVTMPWFAWERGFDMFRSKDSIRRRRPWRWLALALLLISPISVTGAADAFVPSPAPGHAQVVAQGTVVLPGPQAVWRLVDRVAQPRGTAVVGKRVLGFVVPVEAPVLLTNVTGSGDDEAALVHPGEFYLVREGT